MNRYEQYVPVQLNYKPFIPNFDKWGEVLKEQQNKYDTFNQSFNLAVPEHIKQDTEEFKIWNNYLQNSKDEVKNAFIKDPQLGNQKLKNKMFELQKEMNSGLYKGLETRKAEYVAASNQLSEEIKDQPWYKQDEYMFNFKAKPMNYKDGEFSHINPVSTTKDAQRNKRLQEYAEKIKPPTISTQMPTRYSTAADNLGNPGDYLIDEEIITKGLSKSKFDADMQAFINANPDIKEDIEIEARVRARNLAEPDKVVLLEEHKADIIEEKNNLNDKVLERMNTSDAGQIMDLQKAYGLEQTGERSKELDEAILEDAKKGQESLDKAIDVDERTILYHKIIKAETDAYFPLIEQQQTVKRSTKTNDYAKMFYDHQFTAQQNALTRAQRDRHQREKMEAIRQQAATDNMDGTVFNDTPFENNRSAVDEYTTIEENYKMSQENLDEKAAKIGLFEIGSPEAIGPMGQINWAMNLMQPQKMTKQQVYNAVNALPKNIGGMSEEKQKAALELAGLGYMIPKDNKTSMTSVAQDLHAFKVAQEQYHDAQALYEPLKKELEPTIQKIRGYYKEVIKQRDIVDVKGNPIKSGAELEKLISSGGRVYEFRDLVSGDEYSDITDQLQNESFKQINKDLPVDKAIKTVTYASNNPKNLFNSYIEKTFKLPVIADLSNGQGADPFDPTKPAVFVDSKTRKSMTLTQVSEKVGGFSEKNTQIRPTNYGNKAAWMVKVKDDNGKVIYEGAIAMGGGNVNIESYKQVVASAYHTAVQSGDPKADWFANQYQALNNNTPSMPKSIVKRIGPDIDVYNQGEHAGKGKLVKSGMKDVQGVEHGTMLHRDKYYAVYKNKDGNWSFEKNGPKIVTGDGEYEVSGYVNGNGIPGAAWQWSGSNEAIQKEIEESQSDDDDF